MNISFDRQEEVYTGEWMHTGKKRENDYVSCKHKCIQINSS